MTVPELYGLRERVLAQCDRMLEVARDPQRVNLRRERISGWSIGEHLRHLVLANGTILVRLESPDPSIESGPGPTLLGRTLLFLGYIPRGRGRAPAAVVPEELRSDTLAVDLAAIRDRFAALDLKRLATSGIRFAHPVFGSLDVGQWLRFVGVHQHHHGKIIRDIERAK